VGAGLPAAGTAAGFWRAFSRASQTKRYTPFAFLSRYGLTFAPPGVVRGAAIELHEPVLPESGSLHRCGGGWNSKLPGQDGQSGTAERGPSRRPTRPSPKPPGLASVLASNIRTLEERRRREEAAATLRERVADAITRFTGSMRFVYLHIALFGAWIIINLGWIPGIPKFDPSFVIVAMAASVEAIFLSTFILITQNRMTAAAEKRAKLDLQINLMAEHEVTKLIAMVSPIADRLDVKTEIDAEVSELKEDVAPGVVLDEIEHHQR